MTYREYISATLSKFGITDTDIDLILIKSSLDGDTPVVGDESRIEVEKAMFKAVPLMIAGLQDITEGGYSVKWNIAGIKAWYAWLAGELGEEDALNPSQPKIRDKSYMW